MKRNLDSKLKESIAAVILMIVAGCCMLIALCVRVPKLDIILFALGVMGWLTGMSVFISIWRK